MLMIGLLGGGVLGWYLLKSPNGILGWMLGIILILLNLSIMNEIPRAKFKDSIFPLAWFSIFVFQLENQRFSIDQWVWVLVFLGNQWLSIYMLKRYQKFKRWILLSSFILMTLAIGFMGFELFPTHQQIQMHLWQWLQSPFAMVLFILNILAYAGLPQKWIRWVIVQNFVLWIGFIFMQSISQVGNMDELTWFFLTWSGVGLSIIRTQLLDKTWHARWLWGTIGIAMTLALIYHLKLLG